jgi:uncharacterized protein (TIGR00297 family)
MEKIIIGFLLALAIGLISLKFRAVSFSGFWGAIVLGTLVFGLGGMVHVIPLLTFFISGSLLSKLRKKYPLYLETLSDSKPRDIYQVAANGSLAGMLIILNFVYPDFFWTGAYFAVLAEAAADTWATEIGLTSKQLPVSIIGFGKVRKGESGGITFRGTLASVMGSLLIILSGFAGLMLDKHWSDFALTVIFLSFFAGWIGSIFDSFLGASFQGKYECSVCAKFTESRSHCGKESILKSGLKWIGNNAVNFISTLFSLITFTILYLLLI